MLEPTPDARQASFEVLSEASSRGEDRRNELQRLLKLLDVEEHGLGIEMNQRYTSNAVMDRGDEVGEQRNYMTSPQTHYHPTTFPGARVPHVWLRGGARPSKLISTVDLVGKGRFTLLTGSSGQGWREAVKVAAAELNVAISAVQIGFRQEYEDVYFDWAKIRDVGDSGAVLVRPDYFVCWRIQHWTDNGAGRLLSVLRAILAR